MREDTSTVAKAVAGILDSHPTTEERDLPRAIQEIRTIRSAARRIIEAKLDAPDEERLLSALARQAARAELATWCLDGIVEEIKGPDVVSLPPLSYEVAQDRMRRASFERCPACHSRVLSEVELVHFRRRRRWAEEDGERWQGAAS